MPGFAVRWGLSFNPMTTKFQPRAAGQAAHTFTLREVPALDGSGATAHELETDGHTVAHIYPDTGENYAGLVLSALSASARLTAENARLRSALSAIVARVNGEWDHPALVAYGPLQTDSAADCYAIAEAALSAKEGQP
jgi:hypothetical protein